ncbi:conserved membrane hypothetical protein [Bradyrhizobium sp. ORS 375]|uniref:DUF3592 domain-containing protein n=1 Tax=Bradyrhizobium sp. (strain ORS 375) TaxID=566679 RepID=UPI000240A18C|nr:DUF3592 domain-containing protein [Bradyrhizobium sp. ORS 375]CCD92841.1 conserved membrane hypothetical protein [Bradyrhizobium sp. ORS 375]
MLTASALLWTRVAAGIFGFLALNSGYGLWLQRRKSNGGRNWPVVEGEIVASEVSVAATHRSADDTDAKPDIRYRYAVLGKSYEGHRIRFASPGAVTRLQADELTGKYPKGAKVRVFYDPKHPSQSVLEPANASGTAALIALFVVLSAVTTVLVAHSLAGKVLTTQAGVPLFAFLMPFALFGFGAVALASYWKLRQERTASRSWPTTAGRIKRSGVTVEITRRENDRGREVEEERFRIIIEYSYAVGGRSFHSTHWNWGWTALYSDRPSAEAIAAKYPANSDVAVYYDPNQPETAVLDPTNKSGVSAPLWVGLVLIAIGALFLFIFTHIQMS